MLVMTWRRRNLSPRNFLITEGRFESVASSNLIDLNEGGLQMRIKGKPPIPYYKAWNRVFIWWPTFCYNESTDSWEWVWLEWMEIYRTPAQEVGFIYVKFRNIEEDSK